MKILMCTPRMGIGGAETHVLTLAAELVRRGHEVTVASAGGMLVPSLEAAGVRHIPLPLDRKDPVNLVKALRGLRRAAIGCHIVHAHGRYPAFLCGILAQKAGFPAFVTTAHGVTSPRQPQRALSRWGEAVISVSDTVTAYLQTQHRVPAERIRFIPNGVSGRTSPLPADSEAHPFRIAAAGRFAPDTVKPYLSLLETFGAFLAAGTPATLTLWGGGNAEKAIRAAATRINRNHPGAVILPGETADLRTALRESACDLFVGQSRAALEAMAEGIPTVLYAGQNAAYPLTPDNAESLFRGNYMPAEPEDRTAEGALLRELTRFAENADLRKQTADFENGFVTARNALRDIADRTLRFYTDVLQKRRPGIVLCGYFGAGNLGDEATLQAVSAHIRRVFGPISCYVITRNPKAVPDGCTGIRRTDIFGIRRALKASRVFLLCGGSLLQNSTSNRSLWYYSAVFRAARRAGLRTQIFGGGIGPLRGKRAEKWAQDVLSSADAVGLRDTESLTYAGKYTRYAYLSADAVLSVRPKDPPLTEKTHFAVCPRPLAKKKDTRRLRRVLSDTVEEATRTTGAAPIYFALSPADLPLCQALAAAHPGEIVCPARAQEAITRFLGCRFTLSVRLHGAVLSLCAGIPSLCLSYDPKVDAFAAEAGLPCFPAAAVTSAALQEAITGLPAAKALISHASSLQERGRADCAFLEMLYSPLPDR